MPILPTMPTIRPFASGFQAQGVEVRLSCISCFSAACRQWCASFFFFFFLAELNTQYRSATFRSFHLYSLSFSLPLFALLPFDTTCFFSSRTPPPTPPKKKLLLLVIEIGFLTPLRLSSAGTSKECNLCVGVCGTKEVKRVIFFFFCLCIFLPSFFSLL